MKRNIALLVVLTLVSLLIVAGCSKESTNPEAAPKPTSGITGGIVAEQPSEVIEEPVQVQNIDLLGKAGYSQDSLTLKVGDSVTWTNKDPARKRIVVTFGFEESKRYWNSPLILPDETYTFMFTTPGEYVFWNLAYDGKGTIVVEE